MRTRSLTRRTIFSVLLIELLCTLAFVGTALWHERRIRLRALDVTLEGRSDSLIGAVQDAEDPEDTVKVDPAEFNPPSSDIFAVYSETGQLVGATPEAPSSVVSILGNGFRTARSDGHYYRVLQRRAIRILDRDENGGGGVRRPVTVLYAVRTDHLWHEILEAASFYVLMSLGLLGISALVLIVLLRRLFDPLQDLAAEAADIRMNSLEFHAPRSATRLRELLPLADALTTMVGRLRAAFEIEHQFISDAAHELKTAVAVVRSTVQVLGMRLRSAEEYQTGLDQVLADNVRVEELISRMLTLARFEERTGSPPEPINLSQQVEATAKKLATYAEARGVLIRSSFERGVRVSLPPEGAEIIASNLILNAIQHSPKGSEVIVSVRLRRTGHRQAWLVVQDFGSGIAPENLTRVFDRFYREDPSRSRETGGFGLGLAICKSIVEAADGEIRVQSVRNQGTVVTVLLGLA
jgi:signal transduction histidine kinase